jgi:hypothetical protein
MTIYEMIESILGTTPLGYEYLVYKTACVLLVGFCVGFFLIILQFQKSFSRRPN